MGWCRGSTFSTLYKWEYRKTKGICVLLLLYFDWCFLFLPFFIWGCCFSNINVSKRVSSIQLVVTWCTLQQHLSMHLTTSRLTSTGMLESLSSIFLSLTWSWWKLVHYYLTLLYPDYRCTADCGWITGHSYVTYGPMLNGASVIVYEGVINFNLKHGDNHLYA